MRLSSSLLFLPALVAAQQQVPLQEQLQGWFDKAKSYLPTNVPSAAAPAYAPAAEPAKPPPVLSEKPVTPMTISTWQSVLAPVEPGTPGTQREWLVFITGGNKTCFGHCLRADEAFTVSVPWFFLSGIGGDSFTDTLCIEISSVVRRGPNVPVSCPAGLRE